MATGFLDPIPLRARNYSNANLFCCFSTSFQSFLLQSSTQLSQTEFFKELHFFRETQSTLGYIVE